MLEVVCHHHVELGHKDARLYGNLGMLVVGRGQNHPII